MILSVSEGEKAEVYMLQIIILLGKFTPKKAPEKSEYSPRKKRSEKGNNSENGKPIKCAKIAGSIIYIMDPDQ